MNADALLGLLGRRRAPHGITRASRPAVRPRRPARRGRAVPRFRPRTFAILAGLLAVLVGAWVWLRDSPLVAVTRVSITGVAGPDARQIRSALRAAAGDMTTLDVRMSALRTAVAPYPAVRDLRVSTQFPHGMRIRVIEQTPVGAVVVGGRTVPVSGDGTLLHDTVAPVSLPTIPLRAPPGGTQLTEPDALSAVALLAAAPYRMLGKISQVTTVAGHGLVAQLRNGPSIYFGDAGRLEAKWLAAAAVLADPGSVGALYIDVTEPDYPVAGSGASPTSGTGSNGTASVSASGPASGSTTPSGG